MKYVFKSVSVMLFDGSDLMLSNDDEVDINVIVETPSFMYADIHKNGTHATIPMERDWFNRYFKKAKDWLG